MYNKLYALTTLLLGGLFFTSCGGNEPSEQQQSTEAEEEAVAVEATQVERRSFPQLIRYTGNVEAWETAYITGQSGVRIDKIHVDEGDRVRKGQLLATMNSAQLNQARAQLELARREVRRLDTLVKIGSVSGQQFDQAQTELENAQSNYESLAQNTRLTANFNGVVTAKYFSEGEMFVPSADAPSILTVMQLDPVKVTINVAESYYARVNEGMTATIRVDVYPDEEFTGKIYKKLPTIDKGSRTFEAEIRVNNGDGRLRPGMFARVSLDLGETEGIFVPANAVMNQPGTGNKSVFIKEGDRVTKVSVETGSRYQDLIQITSGLEPGQTLITEGLGKLNEGTLVRVMNDASLQAEN